MMLSIDAKFWGVLVMGGAVIILFFLPWLDHSPVKSIRYRPSWHKYVYGVFVINLRGAGPTSACSRRRPASANASRRSERSSISVSSC